MNHISLLLSKEFSYIDVPFIGKIMILIYNNGVSPLKYRNIEDTLL